MQQLLEGPGPLFPSESPTSQKMLAEKVTQNPNPVNRPAPKQKPLIDTLGTLNKKGAEERLDELQKAIEDTSCNILENVDRGFILWEKTEHWKREFQTDRESRRLVITSIYVMNLESLSRELDTSISPGGTTLFGKRFVTFVSVPFHWDITRWKGVITRKGQQSGLIGVSYEISSNRFDTITFE